MRCRGGKIGIASAAENAKMCIAGLSTMKGRVGTGRSNGFRRAKVET